MGQDGARERRRPGDGPQLVEDRVPIRRVTVAGVRSALESWCAEKNFTPVHVWPGSSVTQGFLSKIEPAWSAKMLDAGVVGLWMPNNTSANTLSIVGGKPSAWDKTADPKAHTEPLS